MLKLGGPLPVLNRSIGHAYLATVTTNLRLPVEQRSRYAVLTDGNQHPSGFRAILHKGRPTTIDKDADCFQLSAEYAYLEDGDIVRLDPNAGLMRCLYRKRSPNNTILLTERCNHYCLMCSQPPKPADDSWLLDEAFALISILPQDAQNIGFSGGEPTLYGSRFIELLRYTKEMLPKTAIDVLSNGRAFKDFAFAQEYAAVQHPDLVIGIPVYSDDPVRHDYVVQSHGAFSDTIHGILNLKAVRQRVEVRIVIHKQTVGRLVRTCEFIARNLLFVDHVALMGLEITGFTRPNLELLWIDPYEYKDTLSEAVAVLRAYGIHHSVYNHQLCTVNPDVYPSCRKSISDWKNEFLDDCAACRRKNDCGGLFSSSKRHKHSEYIRSISG